MANPLRYRINDITGTCFDGFINSANSVLQCRMRTDMVQILNSVRPLSNPCAIYAAMLLAAAGYRETIDFELMKIKVS